MIRSQITSSSYGCLGSLHYWWINLCFMLVQFHQFFLALCFTKFEFNPFCSLCHLTLQSSLLPTRFCSKSAQVSFLQKLQLKSTSSGRLPLESIPCLWCSKLSSHLLQLFIRLILSFGSSRKLLVAESVAALVVQQHLRRGLLPLSNSQLKAMVSLDC